MKVFTGYLAIYEFESELEKELTLKGLNPILKKDRFYLIEGDHPSLIWAQATFFRLKEINITSINDGIKQLKNLGRNWALYTVGHHRRAQLIQDGLPKLNAKPFSFLGTLPQSPMGFWTMLDQNLILATQETSSLFPLGEIQFQEDKIMPPSRAYLKLWEFFTLYAPEAKGKVAIDVGSCPGGWTWVLRNLPFEKIISVDKAPIEKRIYDLGQIDFKQESAFGLNPQDLPEIDWFCSDIICYPERLYHLVQKFRESKKVKNFVCTIKYQSETDWETTKKFLEIPHSKIIHLYHNKHEVTWFLKGDQ